MLRLIEAPKSEPVSVDELKKQCRIEHDHENKLLKRYIIAAREYCEGVINYRISRQRVTACYERFEYRMLINVSPVISVDRVAYYDTDNALQVIDSAQYNAAISDVYTILTAVDSWPTVSATIPDAVQIDLTVGKAQPAEHHKQAILMIASGWYKNREDVSDLKLQTVPHGAERLLNITNNQVF